MGVDTHQVRPWRRAMVARDPNEPHRAATPLELFFDLCFVVAVAQVAAQLHHALGAGHWNGVIMYLVVFFTIWWPWANYTWLVSGYDTDDVPFRLLTLVQMAGVLLLSAGVAAFFEHFDNRVAVIAYVVMRLSVVLQWLRVAREYPTDRARALTYVVSVSGLQALWLASLLLPGTGRIVAFGALSLAELAVPVLAERGRHGHWHPGHLAERMGLFTILVLGEVVLSSATAFRSAADRGGVTVPLLGLAGGGLLVCFAMWWTFFDHDLAAMFRQLTPRQGLTFSLVAVWLFACVAAVGAGLHVAVDAVSGASAVSPVAAALACAVPVAVYQLLGAATYIRVSRARNNVHPIAGALAAAAVLGAAFAAGSLTVAGSVALMGVVLAASVAWGVGSDQRLLRVER